MPEIPDETHIYFETTHEAARYKRAKSERTWVPVGHFDDAETLWIQFDGPEMDDLIDLFIRPSSKLPKRPIPDTD